MQFVLLVIRFEIMCFVWHYFQFVCSSLFFLFFFLVPFLWPCYFFDQENIFSDGWWIVFSSSSVYYWLPLTWVFVGLFQPLNSVGKGHIQFCCQGWNRWGGHRSEEKDIPMWLFQLLCIVGEDPTHFLLLFEKMFPCMCALDSSNPCTVQVRIVPLSFLPVSQI